MLLALGPHFEYHLLSCANQTLQFTYLFKVAAWDPFRSSSPTYVPFVFTFHFSGKKLLMEKFWHDLFLEHLVILFSSPQVHDRGLCAH